MNNIRIILALLCLVSFTVFVFSAIELFLYEMEGRNSKESKIIFIISCITVILSFVLTIIYSIKNPAPTFREVCEANNGIYIENNGRAGDSCIYNRQVGEDNEY